MLPFAPVRRRFALRRAAAASPCVAAAVPLALPLRRVPWLLASAALLAAPGLPRALHAFCFHRALAHELAHALFHHRLVTRRPCRMHKKKKKTFVLLPV